MLATESSLRLNSSSARSWAMIVASSANLRFESLFPLIETPRLLQFKLRNKSSKVTVNNFGEIVSPCCTPLQIGISLLCLCSIATVDPPFRISTCRVDLSMYPLSIPCFSSEVRIAFDSTQPNNFAQSTSVIQSSF